MGASINLDSLLVRNRLELTEVRRRAEDARRLERDRAWRLAIVESQAPPYRRHTRVLGDSVKAQLAALVIRTCDALLAWHPPYAGV